MTIDGLDDAIKINDCCFLFDSLDFYLKGEDKRINRKIDIIIGLINASLNDKYWEDNISRLDARLGRKVFQKELAAAVSLEAQVKMLSKQISVLERIIERKENQGRPTDAEEARLAAIHNALPAFQEVLEDLAQADKVLAEVALGDARDMTVNNPKFEKAYNRYLDRAEQQMNKAMAALEDGKSARAIKYFKNAWYYAQQAIRYASRN